LRTLKFLIGLLLLPACVAATQSLAGLLLAVRPGDAGGLPLAALWLVGGFVLWIVLFFSFPRPTRTYVLAHELTHALWGVVMGARVSRIRVGKSGGSVTLSKSNFLIGLAPYFFPFYTMCVIALYGVLSLFLDLAPYQLFWIAAIGLTWGFHLTFTISTLMQHQPDIAEHGSVFSYAVIYLFNVLGIGLWLVAVTPVRIIAFTETFLGDASDAYATGLRMVNTVADNILRIAGL
jgi:hypothetical protein